MEIIAEYPAFKIVAEKAREFAAGEKIALFFESKRYGKLPKFFKLGSVAAYAAQYDEDPAAAIAQAMERGDQLFWANACAVVLHNGPKVQEVVAGFEYGEEIAFAGKRFKLEPAANQNVKLVEVA